MLPRKHADPAADPAAMHPDPARKAGRAMALALKLMLDRVTGARDALPHLAALERALAADGTAVLGAIPLPSLKRMGAQLAALPLDLDNKPLRALQVQLQAAILRREDPPPPPRPAPLPYLPSSLDESRVEVTEVSESEWAAASQIMEDGPGKGP
ncbi:MAG: hypothetical protein H6932_11035 [Burkholderiaceae bacterium]|nr:hypothetical protein [Burkholderiaceae bacterium]